MCLLKCLEEISTKSHTVLRYFSLAIDSGSLTFVSFKALEDISTSLHAVLRSFSSARDSGSLTFVSKV